MQKTIDFTYHLHQSITHKQAYDEWAITHDEEVMAVNYRAPYSVALEAIKVCPSGIFLDIGCGTGLVAESIRSNCSETVVLDGCDASKGMLRIASEKKIYRSLVNCDIHAMPFAAASYDLITAAGVLVGSKDRQLAGNPDHRAIPEIARLIKPNGFFVFTVSCRVWETDHKDYKAAIADCQFKHINCIERPYHDVIPTAMYFVLQKKS